MNSSVLFIIFLFICSLISLFGWKSTSSSSLPLRLLMNTNNINNNNDNNNKLSNRMIELNVPGSNNRRYNWALGKVAFSLLPLYPNDYRKTLSEVIIPNKIWTFDQIQGIFHVNVPVRCVVIKLKEGGLFVYNPLAPTIEFIEMIKELENQHGKVKYIILGTVGLEHKAFLGPFANYFRTATVYIQPGQWSFPFDLPNTFLGFPLGRRVRDIPKDKSLAPWIKEFDYSILGPLRFKSVGGFSETVFFHRETKTLLVTDLIVKVGKKPSPILEDDPRALLYHSRDEMLQEIEDNAQTRNKGWKRMALFGLTFFPSGITIPNPIETLLNIFKVSKAAKQLGEGAIPLSGGLYPWKWIESEEKSFQSLQGGIFIAPILTEIIFNREPERVLSWAQEVSKWPIQRIIPSHLENNILTTSQEFLQAFNVLKEEVKEAKLEVSSQIPTSQPFFLRLFSSSSSSSSTIRAPMPLQKDLKFIKFLSSIFEKYGIN